MDGTNQSPTEQFTAKPGHPGGADAAPDAALRPYWLAADLDIDALPAGLRLAISEILTPAYRELVIEAATALERATGATLRLPCLWLELLEQFDLGHAVPGTEKLNGKAASRQAALDRLLRLVGAKQKAANFLRRIKEWRARTSGSMRGWASPADGDNFGIIEIVDQNRQRILAWLAARPGPVWPSGQGARIWRRYGGRRLGPYYRFMYRDQGKQQTLYLGGCPAFAAQVRQELDRMQAGLQQECAAARRRAAARAALRQSKQEWAAELTKYGLYLKGFEVRGFRQPSCPGQSP